MRWSFLDARELEPEGKAAADEVFDRAAREGLRFIPVTGLTRTSDVSAALRHGSRGLAIRLTRDEFEAGNLASLEQSFITRHAINRATTDLIVDLGPVGDMVAAGIARFAIQFLTDVPNPGRWRTLILSASSFPMSMGIVHRNSHSMEPRGEGSPGEITSVTVDQSPGCPRTATARSTILWGSRDTIRG